MKQHPDDMPEGREVLEDPKEDAEDQDEDKIDEASKESFPSSDPPAW